MYFGTSSEGINLSIVTDETRELTASDTTLLATLKVLNFRFSMIEFTPSSITGQANISTAVAAPLAPGIACAAPETPEATTEPQFILFTHASFPVFPVS